MQMNSSQPISMKERWIWFSVTSVVMVVFDQWMKWYAIHNWRELPPRSFFFDIFRVTYAENHGAFLGLGGRLPDEARFWILVVMNGLVLVGVTAYLLLGKKINRYVFLAFALVVAGGIGNMIDRIRFGYVVDFFNLGIGGLRTGIFNIADMAITAGFFMMFPLVWSPEAETATENESVASRTDGVSGSPAS